MQVCFEQPGYAYFSFSRTQCSMLRYKQSYITCCWMPGQSHDPLKGKFSHSGASCRVPGSAKLFSPSPPRSSCVFHALSFRFDGAVFFLTVLSLHAKKPLNAFKVETSNKLPLKSTQMHKFVSFASLQLRISKMGNACLPCQNHDSSSYRCHHEKTSVSVFLTQDSIVDTLPSS